MESTGWAQTVRRKCDTYIGANRFNMGPFVRCLALSRDITLTLGKAFLWNRRVGSTQHAWLS